MRRSGRDTDAGHFEMLLILPVAGTQHHHLHIHLHDLMEDVRDQRKTLVPHQAGDAGDDGGGLVLTQAHLPLRASLQAVLPLAGAAGVKLAAKPGMTAGSYRAISMPFRIPWSLPLCWLITPSMPWA